MAATAELITEEVAENLEEVAVAVRRLDTKAVGFMLVGLGVGAAIGFYFGYRYNREKLKMEAYEDMEAELQTIREYYGRTNKPELENIVEERGYVTPEPPETPVRPLPAPVPVAEPEPFSPPTQPITPLEEVGAEKKTKDKDVGWSYPVELQRRTPNTPYIIHQDEYMANESEFSQVTLTYYEGDDVLADTDDSIITNRLQIIGDHLGRFGHGSDDWDVLYIRNPHLEMEYEVCRVQKSFEVEVEGLDDDEPGRTDVD